MELYQCIECGHGGWTNHELVNGLCPECRDNEEFYDDETCSHQNYTPGHSPFVPCICNDCGQEI